MIQSIPIANRSEMAIAAARRASGLPILWLARPLALLFLLLAVPVAAQGPASDSATVEGLVHALAAGISAKDRDAVTRLTWPDGGYSVTLMPRADPPKWVRMSWEQLGFPPDISYRTTVLDVRVEVHGDSATVEAQVAGQCYRGERFTGIHYESANHITAERRGGEWRIRDWARDSRRLGEGDC